MVNTQKQKGNRWEKDFVDLLNEKIVEGSAKRIPGSGAIGTVLKEPFLTGDVVAKYPGLNKKIKFDVLKLVMVMRRVIQYKRKG